MPVWRRPGRGAKSAAGGDSSVKSSGPCPSIFTGRRNTRSTKFARRSAFLGRRFTGMWGRLAAAQDAGTEASERSERRQAIGGKVLPTLRSIRSKRARRVEPERKTHMHADVTDTLVFW